VYLIVVVRDFVAYFLNNKKNFENKAIVTNTLFFFFSDSPSVFDVFVVILRTIYHHRAHDNVRGTVAIFIFYFLFTVNSYCLRNAFFSVESKPRGGGKPFFVTNASELGSFV